MGRSEGVVRVHVRAARRPGRRGWHQTWGWLARGGAQVGVDEVELLQGGAEVLGDLGGDDVGLGEAGGVFLAVVFQPEDIEAGLVASDQIVW